MLCFYVHFLRTLYFSMQRIALPIFCGYANTSLVDVSIAKHSTGTTYSSSTRKTWVWNVKWVEFYSFLFNLKGFSAKCQVTKKIQTECNTKDQRITRAKALSFSTLIRRNISYVKPIDKREAEIQHRYYILPSSCSSFVLQAHKVFTASVCVSSSELATVNCG